MKSTPPEQHTLATWRVRLAADRHADPPPQLLDIVLSSPRPGLARTPLYLVGPLRDYNLDPAPGEHRAVSRGAVGLVGWPRPGRGTHIPSSRPSSIGESPA